MRIRPERLKKLAGIACAATAGIVAALMGEAFAFKPLPGFETSDLDAIIAQMEANALD